MDFVTLFRNTAGHLHPVLVHFPIGLVLTGAAVEVRQTLLGREPSALARTLLLLGAVAVLAAMGSGLALFRAGDFRETALRAATAHRALGIASTAAIILGALQVVKGLPLPGRPMRWYRSAYFVAALLVGLAGHYGGWLVFGWGRIWLP